MLFVCVLFVLNVAIKRFMFVFIVCGLVFACFACGLLMLCCLLVDCCYCLIVILVG